jgi:hypothetical protein
MATNLKISQWYAIFWVLPFGQKEIPESKLPGLQFELLRDWNDGLPSLCWVCGKFRLPDLPCRFKFVLDEND